MLKLDIELPERMSMVYNHVMQRFITSLLIVAVFVMPMRSWVVQMQCGCDSLYLDAGPGTVTETCCPEPLEQDNDGSENQQGPCDDQNCPPDCCSMAIGSAFVVPSGSELVSTTIGHPGYHLSAQPVYGSPHLKSLKRPPKSA